MPTDDAYSPDTWSCPTLGLASVLMLRPISPELVLFLDFWSFEHSSVLLFLLCIIRNSFIHKNGNRTYKFRVLGREGPYFVKEHSDSKNKYTEDDIINMLEFLVDSIFVVFGGRVF